MQWLLLGVRWHRVVEEDLAALAMAGMVLIVGGVALVGFSGAKTH